MSVVFGYPFGVLYGKIRYNPLDGVLNLNGLPW
jgi:hypothetical protein